jgi:phosphoribosylaminoimidazole-succinocarboxamide synthase
MTNIGTINSVSSPQLKKIHAGKVRDSFALGDGKRLIVATDRISAFDSVLDSLIPTKGAVLTSIASYWFEKTRHIVPNHIISQPHPQAIVVRECAPIKVEMIVRGYITGSAWRGYEKGKRSFSGASVREGLRKNDKLPTPIVTPTTKEDSDREITPEDIVATGLCSKELYAQMEKISLELFQCGQDDLAKRGLILVDTKYEFGIFNNAVMLIDEIHTPDSSRIWTQKSWQENQNSPVEFDKEGVRRWLSENTKDGVMPLTLPEDVIQDTTSRYQNIYEMVTGKYMNTTELGADGLARALVREGLIRPGYVLIAMGSKADVEHAQKIAKPIREAGIPVELRVVSAHKNGERLAEIVKDYNASPEPGVCVAIAGLSNGLGGALAANLNIPVINCPPFADKTDLTLNVASSLMMPSGVPAVTVVTPELAALAALRALNIRSIRDAADMKRNDMKRKLIDDDTSIRGMTL